MKKGGVSLSLLCFLSVLAATIACLILAAWTESDFGRITVERVDIPITTNDGLISYLSAKLYRPLNATLRTPAPALLALHGYQNDKDTSAAYAMEAARRGMVALSIDQFGHGETPLGMRQRGFDLSIGGPERFKMFMSFSSLNKDQIDGIIDSSMGASAAFRYLAKLDYVDADRIGVTGHSMGTWSAVTTAYENPSCAAVVLQCGEVEGPVLDEGGQPTLRNMLLLQARFDEFDYFRDYQPTVGMLNETENRYRLFAGQDKAIEWNKTYGSFEAGTARRMELLDTVHRLVTHSRAGMAVAMDWLVNALKPATGLASDNLIFTAREFLLGFALLLSVLSLLPLLNVLLALPFFRPVAGLMPDRYIAPKRGRRRSIISGIIISGLLYPFVAQLGHGLFPYPQNLFRTLMAGGLILWLDVLAVIALFLMLYWYRKGEGRRLGVRLYDLGVSFDREKTLISWPILGKTGLIAAVMIAYLYTLTSVSYSLIAVDLRFIWPFLRPLNANRAGQVLLYLPFFLFFFFVNGGVRLYGRLRLKELASPWRTQLYWWLDSVVVMLGGLFLVAAFEYIPFFLGFGTGWSLIGLSLFDGPFMSALVLIVPEFLVLFFVSTYCFRKTGKVYLGSLLTALMVSWITCGGSAFF